MRKYLFFLLLMMVSVNMSAGTFDLTFGDEISDASSTWKSRKVTDVGNLQVGDFVVVSYDEVQTENCQYAICTEDGTKIIFNGSKDYFDCPIGDKNFDFMITQDLYAKIKNDGLLISYNGLSNLKIQYIRMAEENWQQYKPTGNNVVEIMSTPRYIKDWYNEGYLLTTNADYVGKTLRVVCLETGDDSYAFLKTNESGWPSLLSGSDKFSIAGWKYFEIKINSQLNDILRRSDQYGGLRIGGNNYYIAGIYVYDGADTSDSEWKEEDTDAVDTYTFDKTFGETADEWDGGIIEGSFFESKGQGNSLGEKIANTKNNIIRFVFEEAAGSGAQVSAKDANWKDAQGNYASYIRKRKTGDNGFYYVDFADCPQGSTYYDFELSDAITIFKSYNQPVVDGADHVPGVKTGMLSTLLQHGMEIGVKNVKVKKVQIRRSMVSKYVSGYAVYNHKLSDQEWRPIALPYNLTKEQLNETFGSDAVICELGPSSVTKTQETGTTTSYVYGISLSFDKIQDGVNADYPYIIKLGHGKVASDDSYQINNVKADVRDFQSYEFRTVDFVTDALNATLPNAGDADYEKKKAVYDYEQNIKQQLKGVYMMFQSTAPVFDITNTDVGNVEIINGVNQYTTLPIVDDRTQENTNYFFSGGVLVPVLTKERRLKSGLAYVKFLPATYSLFNDENTPQGVSLAKNIACSFGNEGTTGITEIPTSSMKKANAIYGLNGQMIRKSNSTDGLAKGVYIVNGKKMIVK